ncbi:hypothetical protein [Winogradskyella sp. UBA3174]|uniref:hypothetical protein n=1 Tax=Winogradskyella sp. UBA3174 TaxID=1947785 RepID=UPI0025CE5419|nr:hypothetical protein [Winogradskyella sp. UBA3174]|tara:strand:- start:10481 stop:10663 length:183 start_codon:yes stop_codon:yes gene_type:complete
MHAKENIEDLETRYPKTIISVEKPWKNNFRTSYFCDISSFKRSKYTISILIINSTGVYKF